MMMSEVSKKELKAKVAELLNLDDFEEVVRSSMFHGEGLRGNYAKKHQTPEYLLSVQLDLAGIQEKLEEHHGGEGEGDSYWAVWSFTKGDATVYVELNGSYTSLTGAEFDDWYFVEPEEYVAVRYKKV
jgi:hypothetical protein